MIVLPGKYQHYKGAFYRVIATAMHSETQELMVVYYPEKKEDAENNHWWVRPADMFLEDIMVDGVFVPRFRFLGE